MTTTCSLYPVSPPRTGIHPLRMRLGGTQSNFFRSKGEQFMIDTLLTTAQTGIRSAADPERLRFAAKGVFAGLLTFCIMVFLAMQMATAQGRNLLLILALAAAFAIHGVFVLGLAHLTARERSSSKEASPLSAALSNLGAAVGAPALFAGVLVAALVVEIVLFLFGRVDALGPVVVSVVFVPAVVLNAVLLLAVVAANWLGAAVAAARGTAARTTFLSVVALLRSHPTTILPLFLAGFAAIGLTLIAVGMLVGVALSLTMWAAQQAVPVYLLAMITGVPQLLAGQFAGLFGEATGISIQLANLIFLATAIAAIAAVTAYPAVLFSEVSMRICDACAEAIDGVVTASAPRPLSESARFCPHCHSMVGSGSVFCDRCGTKVGTPA